MTKAQAKTKDVSELLSMIYERQVHENSLAEKSKSELQEFIMEVFDKGILNDYLGLHK